MEEHVLVYMFMFTCVYGKFSPNIMDTIEHSILNVFKVNFNNILYIDTKNTNTFKVIFIVFWYLLFYPVDESILKAKLILSIKDRVK